MERTELGVDGIRDEDGVGDGDGLINIYHHLSFQSLDSVDIAKKSFISYFHLPF